MHALFQVLAIGAASNLDNLAVGVTYGVCRISVPMLPNLAIAGIAFLFTLASTLVGTHLGNYMSPQWADRLGALILVVLGIWMLPVWQRKRRERTSKPQRTRVMRMLRRPELAVREHSRAIDFPESTLLGVALSLNCLTNGLPAGLWHLNVWSVAICNAVYSFVALGFGVWFGNRYGEHWLGRKVDSLAGIMLIIIGFIGTLQPVASALRWPLAGGILFKMLPRFIWCYEGIRSEIVMLGLAVRNFAAEGTGAHAEFLHEYA